MRQAGDESPVGACRPVPGDDGAAGGRDGLADRREIHVGTAVDRKQAACDEQAAQAGMVVPARSVQQRTD